MSFSSLLLLLLSRISVRRDAVPSSALPSVSVSDISAMQTGEGCVATTRRVRGLVPREDAVFRQYSHYLHFLETSTVQLHSVSKILPQKMGPKQSCRFHFLSLALSLHSTLPPRSFKVHNDGAPQFRRWMAVARGG